MLLNKLKKSNAIFVITILFLIIVTFGLAIGSIFSVRLNLLTLNKSMYVLLLLHYIVLFIEVLCALIGSYIFLIKSKKSIFLIVSLLITCFEYGFNNYKLKFLALHMGITFKILGVGFGINFIGIVLLIWYLYLLRKNNNN